MSITSEKIKTVHFYYLPFVIDMLLRWFTLGVYRWRSSAEHTTQDFLWFAVEQLVITAITITWILYRFQEIKKKYEFIKQGAFEEKITLLSIIFRLFNVISVTYIIANVIQEQTFYKDSVVGANSSGREYMVYILVFLVYAGIMLFLSFSSIAIPTEYEEEFVSIPVADPLPLGKWVKKLSKKPSTAGNLDVNLDKSLFIDSFDYQIDYNDLQIIKVEGRLRNEHSRVEAYILESVMFGALAFSGFLSIIASERFNFTITERQELLKNKTTIGKDTLVVEDKEVVSTIVIDTTAKNKKGSKLKREVKVEKSDPRVQNTEMRIFWNETMNFLDNLLLFKLREAGNNWNKLIKPSNLIMLITVETLLCALFFLSVIASRLRYTKMTEEIDNLVRLARNFNDKEEEVHNLVMQGLGDDYVQTNLRKRLQSLGIKIAQYLERANTLLTQTRPILIYMSLFRNLGVIMFIVILITSSLFFSKSLALVFLMFSVVAYVYEYVDIKLRLKKQNG